MGKLTHLIANAISNILLELSQKIIESLSTQQKSNDSPEKSLHHIMKTPSSELDVRRICWLIQIVPRLKDRESLTALKMQLLMNLFFNGHFPNTIRVLQLEAMYTKAAGALKHAERASSEQAKVFHECRQCQPEPVVSKTIWSS